MATFLRCGCVIGGGHRAYCRKHWKPEDNAPPSDKVKAPGPDTENTANLPMTIYDVVF